MSRLVFRSGSLVLGLMAAASAHGDEWGTLKGRFVLGGDLAAAAALTVDKDVEICGKHKLLSEEVVVGGDKAVANVVVFVRDKKVKVKPELEAATKTAKPVLDNANCRFEPHVLFVQTGQELEIKNSDTVGHNSNIATVKNAPSNILIPAGGKVTAKFTAEEAVPAQVTCNIHPWMKGWLVVRDNPYAAVSKADGSFEIADLPAGELELQFWHEKAGYLGEMSIGGKKETVKKGRMKRKIKAGDNDLGEVVLDAGLFK
ncbi:MAG: methylamine utilization protein [Planctomycetes bacterium]|nr:methylamine utilization protein [Planctomycetota bacterium]